MKKLAIQTMVVVALLGTSACKVNQTKQAEMPKVDVKTSGGQLPAYNVQGPDVKVGSKTEEVKVPTVKVTTPDKK
ncbi:hypothetical protein ABDK56_12040 [Sphingomonas sp. ASV193]|uniref:hypothetical protein n=1 Tax=Sphingomonas sp. ASV193 TaxID=3144405 RepID=UPI0032E8B453